MVTNFTPKKPLMLEVATRGARRKATELILFELGRIHMAEYEYLDKIPYNMQGGEKYAMAEDTVESLLFAIIRLMDTFN